MLKFLLIQRVVVLTSLHVPRNKGKRERVIEKKKKKRKYLEAPTVFFSCLLQGLRQDCHFYLFINLFFVFLTFEALPRSCSRQRCCSNQIPLSIQQNNSRTTNRLGEVILFRITLQYENPVIYLDWTLCCGKSTHSNRYLILKSTDISTTLSFVHITSDKIF